MEKLASKKKIGIWQGEFVMPWNWRRGERWFCSQEEAKAHGWRPPKN